MAVRTIGPYRIERLIRRGGMGAVYLGVDDDLKRRAAVKVLRDDLDGDDDRARFRREAVAIAALDHPNIIRIFHAGVDEGQPYIAMEYIHGETLAELMRRREGLPLERTLQIVEDVCGALAAAHRVGIVHRDIKPANILVADDGTVKVVDFGIARTPDSALTQLGVLVGTLEYMAPEQFSDDGIDARTDIYAVGVLLYELIARKRPFAGDGPATVAARVQQRNPIPLSVVCPEIDADLASIVQTALAANPAERYADAELLRAALAGTRQRVSGSDAPTLVSRREPPALPPVAAERRPRMAPWRATAAVGAVGLVAVTVYALGIDRWARVVITSELPFVAPTAPPAAGASLPPSVPVDVPAPVPAPTAAEDAPSPKRPAAEAVVVNRPPAATTLAPPLPAGPPIMDRSDGPVSASPTSVEAPQPASSQPQPAALPPAPSPGAERRAVTDVVAQYMQAMSDRNIAAMSDLRRLEPVVKAQMEAQFQELRSWKVTLADPFIIVDVDASSATVTGRIKYQDVRSRDDRAGRVKDQNVRIQLRKTAGAWRITEID